MDVQTRVVTRRRRYALGMVAVMAVTLMTACKPGPRPPFYEPPASLPARNGDLVRSEPSEFYLDPLKAVKADADVHRIMYRSTDRGGAAVAITGTVLVPKTPWLGLGQRPIVGYAVGTQGMGDQCAPSRLLAAGSEYEGIFISGLLARGYAVSVTDYKGLGTPGIHTYLARVDQGNAVLDSVRAAQRLPGTGLPSAGPVAIVGYSQGGGAAAAAAELQPTYASELKLKGVVAGATPADLDLVAEKIDGSPYAAFLNYAVLGVATSYGIDPSPLLNEQGKTVMREIQDQCFLESVATYAFQDSRSLTADGRSINQILGEAPFDTLIDQQRLGNVKPGAPVLVTHSVLDDVIPYQTGKNVASRWCSKGANVRFSSNVAPTHIGGAIASYPEQFLFLEARFAGIPQLANCWML